MGAQASSDEGMRLDSIAESFFCEQVTSKLPKGRPFIFVEDLVEALSAWESNVYFSDGTVAKNICSYCDQEIFWTRNPYAYTCDHLETCLMVKYKDLLK